MPPPMEGFSDKALGEEELVAGSLITVRYWQARTVEPRLVGRYGKPWTAGENVATCYNRPGFDGLEYVHTEYGPKLVYVPPDGRVPDPDCGCGFWSYYARQVSPYSPYGYDPFGVVGVVESYGRVLMGSLGIRAERARILALSPEVTRERLATIPATFRYLFDLAERRDFDSTSSVLEDFAKQGVQVYGSPTTMFAVFRDRFDQHLAE